MKNSQLFSRRPDAAVDFRPDVDPKSPFAQLRRLSAYLDNPNAKADDITDCPDALDYLREYVFMKTFHVTHHEFLEMDASYPDAVDWLLAVGETESGHFQSRKQR